MLVRNGQHGPPESHKMMQCCQKSVVLIGDLGPAGPFGGGTRKMTSMRVSSISMRRTTVRMMCATWVRSSMVSQPRHKIMVRGALRRQILRQRLGSRWKARTKSRSGPIIGPTKAHSASDNANNRASPLGDVRASRSGAPMRIKRPIRKHNRFTDSNSSWIGS
jgi:hypothetical protein